MARTPTAELDEPVRRLSDAANYSRLWLGIAATIALVGGGRGRRAALEGVVAIGVTSATVNLGVKPLARRRRPDRAEPGQFPARQVPMPGSTSFPSGHAASAFAFAYAVGRHLPVLGLPIRLLAAGVAYSRVHTGVHYPGDVVLGAILGAATAAMVAAFDRLPQPQQRPRRRPRSPPGTPNHTGPRRLPAPRGHRASQVPWVAVSGPFPQRVGDRTDARRPPSGRP